MALTIASVLGGAVSAHFFQGPQVEKYFKTIGLDGLQGGIFTIASLCISLAANTYLQGQGRSADITLTASSFAGGVVLTYFSRNPQLNKEGFKALGLGGLQGTILAVASLWISLVASSIYTKTKNYINDADMALAAAATFAAGVASTYSFHRPELNKEGFKILGLGGLQGTILTLASGCIGAGVAFQAEKPEDKHKFIPYMLITQALCGALIAVAAGNLTTRLGTPIQALTNFAISSVLGGLALYTTWPEASKKPI